VKLNSSGKVFLFGPSLGAVSGVSTHLNQLLGSRLSERFELVHFQIGSEGRTETRLGRLVRLMWAPAQLAVRIIIMRPAIVHLNTSLNEKAFWRDVVYLYVAKLLRRKVVYQVHGGALVGFSSGSKVLRHVLKCIFKAADAVVVLSSFERDSYKRFANIKDLVVIPNAVDLVDYKGTDGKDYDGKINRLVYIGRLDYQKGIFEAIEALKILHDKEELSDLNLVVAGSGPAESALRNRIKELALDEYISLIGPVFGTEKTRFWQDADIFVFPSYQEGLPYTVLESLASGTPMVTTKVGGIPDAVEDGVHAVFVQPRNPTMLAEAIKNLVQDKDRLTTMSFECRKRAQQLYGTDRLAKQFSELYVRVLA